MALAASARVTTEQELNLPVAALLVVDATDALVAGAAPDEVAVEEEEPHAARRTAARTPTMIARTCARSLIRPLNPVREPESG
jgi:hypothetical protein